MKLWREGALKNLELLLVSMQDYDQPHVVATRRNDDVVTARMGHARVDKLIAALPGRA